MTVHVGDCLRVLSDMEANSVDSIVTDPPYGLKFMGKQWDYEVPSVEIWAECLRVLKPGGHLLAFAGTRTQHRMAVRIEDAGFEIRDMIAWVYGSGFPKSLDVSKAMDKSVGAVRSPSGIEPRRPNSRAMNPGGAGGRDCDSSTRYDTPASELGRHWSGWGTALKPALEPITLARKPLEGTVAANVLAHGVGGLNIDACRVGSQDDTARPNNGTTLGRMNDDGWQAKAMTCGGHSGGRWPANLIHDGSEEVLDLFPDSLGSKPGTIYRGPKFDGDVYNAAPTPQIEFGYGDKGSAARFFYCAKASKSDRGENGHPTVKPTALMRYLCRLVTPPGGLVLDPFAGSGSTGKAAVLEGFGFIGIEIDPDYAAVASARIYEVVNE